MAGNATNFGSILKHVNTPNIHTGRNHLDILQEDWRLHQELLVLFTLPLRIFVLLYFVAFLPNNKVDII